jgi:hypothetical protein
MRALALLAALAAPLPAAAELSQVQVVYLLPMGSGLDQYLANRLTGEQVYQVVTDPRKADAVLTDQIGAGFEERLKELYPPPPEAAPEVEKKEEKQDKDEGVLKGDTGIPRSRFTRGRGNLFLVDIRSRRVLWSVYELPRSSSPDDLDRSSRRIVEKLKKAVQGK